MGKRRMGKIKRIFTVCIVIGILGSILFHVVGITGNISADKIRKTENFQTKERTTLNNVQ